jgi:hypothetical protein
MAITRGEPLPARVGADSLPDRAQNGRRCLVQYRPGSVMPDCRSLSVSGRDKNPLARGVNLISALDVRDSTRKEYRPVCLLTSPLN